MLRESVESVRRISLGRNRTNGQPGPEPVQRAGELRGATGAFDDAWRGEVDSPWVRATAQRIAAEQTRDLPRIIAKLAVDSAAALRECARDLDTSEAPKADEFASVIQEMPLIDVGGIEARLRAGILARTWTGLAVRVFETKLKAEIGRPLSQAFSAYSGVLQRWTRDTLKDLRERFDIYAESYRGKIVRLEGTSAGQKVERALNGISLV